MEENLTGIEFRLQKVAQKIKRLEAENELFKQENEALKAKIQEIETQQILVAPTAAVQDEDAFLFQLNQARKAKRELELYLREIEKRIEDIRF